MRTFHWIGSVALISLVSAFGSVGCSITGSPEKTTDQALDQSVSKDPSANSGPATKPGCDPGPVSKCIDGTLGDSVTCEDISSLKQQAADACAQAGLPLTGLKYVEAGCPAGQASFAAYACCEPTPPPPPDQCIYGELGDGSTCQDPAALKLQATDACKQAGLDLTVLKSTQDCPGGASTKAYYACCKPTPPPPPDPCTYGEIGDGSVCQDPAVLEQQAADACTQAGLPLSSTKTLQDCAGGFSSKLFYACCPPPPPDPCTYGELGDGSTCIDPSTLKQQVADACSQAGLEVSYLKAYQDCPGGASTKAYYGCCPPAPPPPPDPCTNNELGDGTTCVDPNTLKQQAADACSQAGLELSYLKSYQDCPGGASTKAYYGCCPASPLKP
jgi:hypothetical protein